MQFKNKLRHIIDEIKPNFSEGGKFSFLHSTFNAFETFFFVPDEVTTKGTHIKDAIDIKRSMIIVVIALLPCLLFGIYNTGLQHYISIGEEQTFFQICLYGIIKILPLIIVSYVVGLGIEFTVAQIRKHEVNEGYLVTGMIIPLIVPIDIPLWMLAIATAFAVIIGKEIFGGTGFNILNPALFARAFLFFAFPSYMTGDKVWISGLIKSENIVDGFSGETLLSQAITSGSNFIDGFGNSISFQNIFIGTIPGCVGETSTIAILIGAVILLFTGIASWRIMLSVLVGGSCMGIFYNLIGTSPLMQIPWYEHLILGGFAFGMVFMATDPVTATQTNVGKYIYGFLIGVFAITIRVVNPAYPEGMMLAILLMNIFAPLIDYVIVEFNIKKRLKRLKTNE
ncbi:MAG: NADH:ubiquinone reductase (Na(+)-transporting) subunit B [Bacteroidales bacterium]|jgi:Na+-transporting NADH:ubiquinone oxidoreductase subunit B|nr:NADH:ubiquinone reductase (Na(+)-transporting) subunit B [Bacteroidales bacterium]